MAAGGPASAQQRPAKKKTWYGEMARHFSAVSFHASEWGVDFGGPLHSDAREWKGAQKGRPRQRAGALTILLEERLEASRVARPAGLRALRAPALGTGEDARARGTVIQLPLKDCGIRPRARYPAKRYDSLPPIVSRQAGTRLVLRQGRRPRARLRAGARASRMESTQCGLLSKMAYHGPANTTSGRHVLSVCVGHGANVRREAQRGAHLEDDSAAFVLQVSMAQHSKEELAISRSQEQWHARGSTRSGSDSVCVGHGTNGRREAQRGVHLVDASAASGQRMCMAQHSKKELAILRPRVQWQARSSRLGDIDSIVVCTLHQSSPARPSWADAWVRSQRLTRYERVALTTQKSLTTPCILFDTGEATNGAWSIEEVPGGSFVFEQFTVQLRIALHNYSFVFACCPGPLHLRVPEGQFERFTVPLRRLLHNYSFVFVCCPGPLHLRVPEGQFERFTVQFTVQLSRLLYNYAQFLMPAKKGGASRRQVVPESAGVAAKLNAAVANSLKAKRSEKSYEKSLEEEEAQRKAVLQKRLEEQSKKAQADREFNDNVSGIVKRWSSSKLSKLQRG